MPEDLQAHDADRLPEHNAYMYMARNSRNSMMPVDVDLDLGRRDVEVWGQMKGDK